jgi:serine/threonine-protein kinase
MEEGVDDCINSPFEAAVFLARVRACFRRRQSDDSAAGVELTTLLEANEPSVAVLPFADLSPGQDQAYLCDGLAEELTHALARVAGLRVAARTSSFRFRSVKSDVRDIGRQLGVSAVLEGSVQKSGARLRILARLVNVDDGCELMSERYERDLTDVFALEDEIARHVSERLRVVLLGLPEGSRATASGGDVDAHDLYLKGRYAWNQRTEEGLTRSVEHFQQSIARDPNFAAAHAGLANAYVTLAVYGTLMPGRAMPLALEAADRALAIDATSAEAMVARSSVRALYLWDWQAEDGFLRALELEPHNPTAHHWYAAHYLMPLGRFADARTHLERAASLDPLSSPIRTTLGVVCYFEREHEQAVALQRHIIATDRDFGMAYYFLGLAQAELGRFDEAIEALGQAKARSGETPEIESALGYTLARAGEAARARGVLGGLTRLAGERYVSPVLPAQVAGALGDMDLAFKHFDDAFDRRATELVWLAVRPTFDGLRRDSRLVELQSNVLG